VKDLERQMKKAARDLEFEKAALLRDQVVDLRKVLVDLGASDGAVDPEPDKAVDLAPTAEDGVPEELVGAD
jgi:excinuclease ABC subunit B